MNPFDYRNQQFGERTTSDLALEASAEGRQRDGEMADFANQIEDFLTRQVGQLETTIDRCQEILRREHELEVRREGDLDRIEQETIRLAEAWLRLELEQRHAVGPVAAVAGPAVVQSVVGVGQDPNGQQERSAPATHELAVRQFQQMRREIGKHARKTN